MARLDKEKEARLQPKRIQTAIDELQKLGFEIYNITTTSIQFQFKGERVVFFPYSGWHTGKTIVDGRGLDKLLNQIRNGDNL
jgi:hypothetical protein